MKTITQRLILLFTFLIISTSSFASHILGSELTYSKDSNNVVQFTLELYHDDGVSVSSSYSLDILSSCGNSQAVLNIISNNSIGSCYLDSTYSRTIYKGSTTLNQNCSNYQFNFNLPCCRPLMKNLLGGSNYSTYTRAKLINSSTTNNSAIIQTEPYTVAFVGEESNVRITAKDLDGDSIAYNLVNSIYTGYAPSYNGSNPFGANSTIQIDQESGMMTFTPTSTGRFLVVLEIEEYRNGVFIGSSMREWPVYVYNTNSLPVASGINGSNQFNYHACVNDSLFFQLYLTDQNNSTITATLDNQHSGAAISQQGNTVNFSWDLSSNSISVGDYDVYLKLDDGNCGVNYFVYTIDVDSCNAYSPVWPGDANDDQIANVVDVLYVGLAFGSNGPTRQNASNQWIPQPAQDWSQQFFTGINYKHTDCDGNGTIDAADLIPIALNYGKIHPKANPKKPYLVSNPDLFIDAPDSIYSNQQISIPIKLGQPANPISAAYGLAFSLTIDTSLIDESSLQLDLSNSLMGSSNSLISMVKYISKSKQVDIVISRTDGNDFNGNGIIGKLNFTPTPTSTVNNLAFQIESSTLINSSNVQIPLNNMSDSTILVDNGITSIDEISQDEFKIFPIPASNKVYLKIPSEFDVTEASIYSISGEVILSEVVSADDPSINVRSLSPGVYLLRINTRGFIETRKLIIK